jgi:phage-related minor tail protein
MPLTRGPDGNLGVRAHGSGGNVTVNVINNAQGTQATARERTDGNGNRMIEVFIEQVKGAIAGDISRGSGAVPDAMASTYGLNRVAGAY